MKPVSVTESEMGRRQTRSTGRSVLPGVLWLESNWVQSLTVLTVADDERLTILLIDLINHDI